MELEVWKEIDGFPNYEISNLGRARNKVRERILTQTPVEKGGYLTVTIGGKRRKVHRLVAIAFIPNPLNLPQVHHKDKDVTNNAESNLEWITNAENNKSINKTIPKKRVRFSKRQVFNIHKQIETKTAKELSIYYGCNIDSISKVWNGVGKKNRLYKEQFMTKINYVENQPR